MKVPKVIYTAPNRAHHYIYAVGLEGQGLLYKFISGFSRLSKRSKIDLPKNKVERVDFLQSIYVLSLRFKLPYSISQFLSLMAKIEQDLRSGFYIEEADIFIYYNGCGLYSARKFKKKGGITIVEAVNSHVWYQEKLLEEEHLKLNLPFKKFNKLEVKRRIKEYQEADYILVPSQFVKDSFLENGFVEEKIIKVPFGFKAQDNLNPGNKLKTSFPSINILFVGSVSVRKGLRYLIKALDSLNDLNVNLTVVGPRSIYTGIEDLKLNSNIRFTGALKGAELEREFLNADLFCLPTIEEGLALVIGEALSYGLPVITTVNSGASEIMSEGREGFIVPIRDVSSLASKIKLLVLDEQLRSDMSENAFELAKTFKGWESTILNLNEKLSEIRKY
ncbi:glycosyltransferase family 4 protein [Leeuwenhoekiella sp. MAR_2009_132]|uniref:glycosyltransferase family 4 protein n=1 Tax=Leeuwenhoekiella sp. MAR_2009_132 TaxID=1392489 RepID=UPI0006894351|nr:glycosyltransferase family 4 protein [Leeuwenhoekiella sp. MAR_2009_132]